MGSGERPEAVEDSSFMEMNIHATEQQSAEGQSCSPFLPALQRGTCLQPLPPHYYHQFQYMRNGVGDESGDLHK